MTQGAVQSNQCRQTAAFAAKLGLGCHILLEARTGSNAEDYVSGNVLLDQLHGATTENVPAARHERGMEKAAGRTAGRSAKPYIIPGGGSNTAGALGYVDCAWELLGQADRGPRIDRLVHATGSAGTHAGLMAGLRQRRRRDPHPRHRRARPQGEQEENVLQASPWPPPRSSAPQRSSSADLVADSTTWATATAPTLRPQATPCSPHSRACCSTRSISEGRSGLIDLAKGHFRRMSGWYSCNRRVCGTLWLHRRFRLQQPPRYGHGESSLKDGRGPVHRQLHPTRADLRRRDRCCGGGDALGPAPPLQRGGRRGGRGCGPRTEFAQWQGSGYALACASGGTAMQIALRAAGIGAASRAHQRLYPRTRAGAIVGSAASGPG